MGYLLKLAYFLVVIIPVMNSSEALSNAFSTQGLTDYIAQYESAGYNDHLLLSRDEITMLVEAQPTQFSNIEISTNNTRHSGAVYACNQLKTMTNESLNNGFVMEAKALNFYHGLVKQAANHQGYNNC